ncbi:hypothetical protein MKEN_00659200 [Mycena kentingensis (nom. inval.)]|nr:hypothetical protein MKEN_00659200 [Mycena kentingensis (nom. inval.)]
MSNIELPYELERAIFELTARAHPTSAPKLAFDNLTPHCRIQAVIYHTVVIGALTPGRNYCFPRSLHLYTENVRALHIQIAWGISRNDATKLLKACTSLVSLTFWSSSLFSPAEFYPILGDHLERISVHAALLWSPAADAPYFSEAPKLFARLTHLEIVNPPSTFNWTPLLAAGALPRLTHLAFGGVDAAHASQPNNILDFFAAALASELPKLQMLVVVSHSERFLQLMQQAAVGGSDTGADNTKRLLCVPSYHSPLPISDYWESIVRREIDFWSTKRNNSQG